MVTIASNVSLGVCVLQTVQEEAMVTILTEINRSVDAPHVPTIAKFLKHLTIQTKLAAGMVRKLLNDITEGLQILAAVSIKFMCCLHKKGSSHKYFVYFRIKEGHCLVYSTL